MNSKLTSLQREEIKRRYANKEKVKNLAKEYGVTLMTIYHVLNPDKYSLSKYPTCKELGIDKRMKLSDNEVEYMRYLYSTGISRSELAEKFQVSLYCAKYHIDPEFAKYSNALVAKAHAINPVKIDPQRRALQHRERLAKRKAAYEKTSYITATKHGII